MFEKLLAERHLRHLDMTEIRRKMISKFEWSADKAVMVEIEYKRFLYAMIKKKAGEMISPPSQDVDEFWHQHILFTQKYSSDCKLLFGHYLDHMPSLPPEVQRKADARRKELYREYDIDDLDFDFDFAGHADQTTGESNAGAHGHSADGGHGHGSHGDGGHGHGDSGGHSGDSSSSGDGGSGGDGGGGSGCGGGGCGGG